MANRVLALGVISALLAALVACTSVEVQVSQKPATNLPPCASQPGDSCNCSDFQYQQDAQTVLESDPSDPHRLDGNNKNGFACESLPSRGGAIASPTPFPSPSPTAPTSRSPHLTLGNPSGAVADPNILNNYLMEKPQYVLSYNNSKGIPNWVSWQLNSNWLGDIDRKNDFRPDTTLPIGFYQVRPSDYTGSGYDKGHMTPSGDRTRTPSDNSATFLMTNMIPQAPANNREVWRELEEYSRKLVDQGKELYIIAGGVGQKGMLKGKVAMPEQTWKVVVVLERPDLDVSGVSSSTRLIAVMMPNSDEVARTDWRDYRVSVDAIEAATGYDFLSNVPKAIQDEIESKVDNQ